jgi:hypothetical protein
MTIPLPVGADSAEDWEDGEDCRVVYWPTTYVGEVQVWLSGEQFRPTGDIVRSVMLYANAEPLSPESARQVAAALLNAADELDQLTNI